MGDINQQHLDFFKSLGKQFGEDPEDEKKRQMKLKILQMKSKQIDQSNPSLEDQLSKQFQLVRSNNE